MSVPRRSLPSGVKIVAYADCCEAGEFTALQAVAFIAGSEEAELPTGCCPVISQFVEEWSASLPDDETRTRLLLPIIPTLVETAADLDVTQRRGLECLDWMCRTIIPLLLIHQSGGERCAIEFANLPQTTPQNIELLRDLAQRIPLAERQRSHFFLDGVADAALALAGIEGAWWGMSVAFSEPHREIAAEIWTTVVRMTRDIAARGMDTAPWEATRSACVELAASAARLAAYRATEQSPWNETHANPDAWKDYAVELQQQWESCCQRACEVAPLIAPDLWDKVLEVAQCAAVEAEQGGVQALREALALAPRPLAAWVYQSGDSCSRKSNWLTVANRVKETIFFAAEKAAWEVARQAGCAAAQGMADTTVLELAFHEDLQQGREFTKTLTIAAARKKMSELFPSPLDQAQQFLQRLSAVAAPQKNDLGTLQ